MKIEEIKFGTSIYQAMKAFREEHLRKPLGLELSAEDIEGEEDHIHIAAIEKNDVVGTVVFKPVSQTHLKLRQMAISPELRGQGVGSQLINFAEDILVPRGFKSVEATARVTVTGFYKAQGFEVLGEVFEEVTIPVVKVEKIFEI